MSEYKLVVIEADGSKWVDFDEAEAARLDRDRLFSELMLVSQRADRAESEMREWVKAFDEATALDRKGTGALVRQLAKEFIEVEKYEANKKVDDIREQLEDWNV